MLHMKRRCKQKVFFAGCFHSLHRKTDHDWSNLAVKSVFSPLLCLALLISVSCVTERRMVRLESTVTDTQEALKARNEELSETEMRLSRIEESWDRLNGQLLTQEAMCSELQKRQLSLSEKLEELQLNSVDSDLEIFNRMRELQSQLQSLKELQNGSVANEVIQLKRQVEVIENRIEEIQSRLSENTMREDEEAQESPHEAVMDVINRFDKHYGGPRMDEITDLTTARFRENRPGAVWVSQIWKALNELEYKRLSSVVSESEIEQDRARVILQSEVQTKAGKTKQTEIFQLIRKEGSWLIDKLVVAEDKTDLSLLR